MRTLITGFGPFPGIADNPSERLARHFGAWGAPGQTVTARVLPVSFRWTGPILPALLTAGRYDAALLMGVDGGGSDHLRLERFGRNRTRGAGPDIDGFAPGNAPISTGAPDVLETSADGEGLRRALEGEGLAAYVSEDAGGYVCNFAYYTALRTIARGGLPTRCLFLHVPPDTPAFPLAAQRRAVRILLARLASAT